MSGLRSTKKVMNIHLQPWQKRALDYMSTNYEATMTKYVSNAIDVKIFLDIQRGILPADILPERIMSKYLQETQTNKPEEVEVETSEDSDS